MQTIALDFYFLFFVIILLVYIIFSLFNFSKH